MIFMLFIHGGKSFTEQHKNAKKSGKKEVLVSHGDIKWQIQTQEQKVLRIFQASSTLEFRNVWLLQFPQMGKIFFVPMAWKSSFTSYSMRKSKKKKSKNLCYMVTSFTKEIIKWERLSASAAMWWSFHNFPIKLYLNTDIADGTCISCNERIKNINNLNLEQLHEGFLWKFNHFPPGGKDF